MKVIDFKRSNNWIKTNFMLMNNISVDCTIFMTTPWTIYVIIKKNRKGESWKGENVLFFYFHPKRISEQQIKENQLSLIHTRAYTTSDENHHLHLHNGKGLQHVEQTTKDNWMRNLQMNNYETEWRTDNWPKGFSSFNIWNVNVSLRFMTFHFTFWPVKLK